MKKKYIALTAIIVFILIAGIFILNGLKQTNKKPFQSNLPAALPKEVTVTLTKDGFTPKEVTIGVGSAVRWKNMSGDKQTVNSDDYPTNQLHKELNFGIFNDGSSVVYVFKSPGIYGYHNQFHPEQKGKVIVTK